MKAPASRHSEAGAPRRLPSGRGRRHFAPFQRWPDNQYGILLTSTSLHACNRPAPFSCCSSLPRWRSGWPLPDFAREYPDDVTVSGVSSGGYMPVQFQVAYSGIVRGAGVVAGGLITVPGLAPPGAGQLHGADQQRPAAVAAEVLKKVRLARAAASTRSGTCTTTASRCFRRQRRRRPCTSSMRWLPSSRHPPRRCRPLRQGAEAGHAVLSGRRPQANACPTHARPSSIAVRISTHRPTAGASAWPAASPLPAWLTAKLIAFDQRPFVHGPAIDASLADEGTAFVPAHCRRRGLRCSVAFHGCLQNAGEDRPPFRRRCRL